MQEKPSIIDIKSLKVIGIFLGLFGLVLVYAAIISEGSLAMLTNFVAGGLLVLIGSLALLRSRQLSKKL